MNVKKMSYEHIDCESVKEAHTVHARHVAVFVYVRGNEGSLAVCASPSFSTVQCRVLFTAKRLACDCSRSRGTVRLRVFICEWTGQRVAISM